METGTEQPMLAACVAWGLWLAPRPAIASPAPTFTGDQQVSSQSGAVLLEWDELDGARAYEVEQASRDDLSSARVVYRGAFPSAHVSGLPEGEHSFRVRAHDPPSSAWSATKVVAVRYHPMNLVWSLFGLGLLVVAATTTVVIRGARAQA